MSQVKKGTAPKKADEKTIQLPNVETLLKENEALKKKLAEQAKATTPKKPEDFETLLKFYRERNEKIKELNRFNVKKTQIEEIKNELTAVVKRSDLEAKADYYFSIYAPKGDYNRVEEMLRISNEGILIPLLDYVLNLLNERIAMLESEIRA